jgi:hypothetical protein
MVQWVLTAVALAAAVCALALARRASRRLDRLTESYWALRYEHTSLRTRVTRLEPESAESVGPGAVSAQPTQASFVPLSSLRK